MNELDGFCVKHLAGRLNGGRWRLFFHIQDVAKNRVPKGGQMDPNLVSAAGLDVDAKACSILKLFQYLIMGHCFPAIPGLGLHFFSLGRVSPNRLIDGAG